MTRHPHSASIVRHRGRSTIRRSRISRLSLESLESRHVLATMIGGLVAHDVDGDGIIDGDDPGQSGVTVYIDANENGLLDTVGGIIEPDDFQNGAVIDGSTQGVSFSLADAQNDPIEGASTIVALEDEFASTGSLVFAHDVAFFNHTSRLRIDFDAPVSGVQLNFTGTRRFARETGILEAHSADGTLLGTYTTGGLLQSEYETMTVVSAESNIAYAIAFTKIPSVTGRLDALRIDSVGSELWTISDAEGHYSLNVPEGGTYPVKQIVPDGFLETLPVGDGHDVIVGTGDTVSDVNFANTATVLSGWHNAVLPLDVSGDGQIIPLDALLIINELNDPVYSDASTGQLPPPPEPVPAFFDVDADGFVSPSDVIRVINFLNDLVAPAISAQGEWGTEAAAATAVGPIQTTSDPAPTNRPSDLEVKASSVNVTAPRVWIEPQASELVFADARLKDLVGAALDEDDTRLV